jgi:hypothetical protein
MLTDHMSKVTCCECTTAARRIPETAPHNLTTVHTYRNKGFAHMSTPTPNASLSTISSTALTLFSKFLGNNGKLFSANCPVIRFARRLSSAFDCLVTFLFACFSRRVPRRQGTVRRQPAKYKAARGRSRLVVRDFQRPTPRPRTGSDRTDHTRRSARNCCSRLCFCRF